MQTGDDEAEGVCGGEAYPEHREDGDDEGLVLDDKEDASVPEGVESLLHPPPSGRGMHEVLPGSRRQTVQGRTGGAMNRDKCDMFGRVLMGWEGSKIGTCLHWL